MTSIAVTGGIGSGKSTLLSLVKCLGYPVLDADKLTREVVLIPVVKTEIITNFGTESYTSDGKYHSDHIRKQVFSNPGQRAKLEKIIHPKIVDLFSEKAHTLEKVSPGSWLFYEAALIFETGRETYFDTTVLVTAPLELRLARLAKTRGLDRQDCLKIMDSQWNDDRKQPLADYVLHNNGLLLDLEKEVYSLIKTLSERFSQRRASDIALSRF